MRILLAIDGSAAADRARDLVAGIAWPQDSVIEVMAVIRPSVDLLDVAWPASVVEEPESGGEETRHVVEEALEAAVHAIERPGIRVGRLMLMGHPGRAIVEEAEEFRADLVVLGSRGHGSLATFFLGSVSAAVVDHAPCPVLVARGPEVTGIVVGVDGSECAERALGFLRDFPVLHERPITAVSVAHVETPWAAGLAPASGDAVLESYSETLEEAQRQAVVIATRAADELTRAGYSSTVDVRDGDPSHGLIESAAAHRADLIVTGTHGRTGITRMVLGSVARSVLLHAPCSVLITRPVKAAAKVREPARAIAGAT